MTRADVLRMAKAAGMCGLATTVVCEISELEKFAALVAITEREACAVICDESIPPVERFDTQQAARDVARHCGDAIRARISP